MGQHNIRSFIPMDMSTGVTKVSSVRETALHKLIGHFTRPHNSMTIKKETKLNTLLKRQGDVCWRSK